MSDKKKKLYCAFVMVDEDTDVKEHGAAIRYIDSDGNEQTKQAPMFRLHGDANEIVEELTQRLINGFALLNEHLIPKSKIITPS